jgi:transcription antitermination factor NusG
MDTGSAWYCLRTRPKWENVAATKLVQKQIEVMNPWLPVSRTPSARMVPLFPGYIFARFSIDTDYYRVVWTPGLKSILGNGKEPVAVEPELIAIIADRVAGAASGELQRGDRVHIASGPFRSLDGVFSSYCPGKQRVKVLLDLFNQRVLVSVDLAQLGA